MGRLMAKARHLDVDKVTESLKRAARLALNGSREDRSGRFTPTDTAKKRGTASLQQSSEKK
jgi:hypothetical protein